MIRKALWAVLMLVTGVLLGVGIGTTSAAGPGWTSRFGETNIVYPGHNSSAALEMVSDSDPGFGGVHWAFTTIVKFSEVHTLSTDYNVTDDDCGGGGPRFQLSVDTDGDGDHDGNIFAYIGPWPNYTGCPEGWNSSGDLLETGMFLDTSQLPGGMFYDPYDAALLRYGDMRVRSIQLVTDASFYFEDREQTIWADNTVINDRLVTYDTVYTKPAVGGPALGAARR